jgi:EAL domain-containing protein (putative c-di-GMP-specific phosphodiesterase class I)
VFEGFADMGATFAEALGTSAAATEASGTDEFLSATLRAVRQHLGMDVAFVSEIRAGRRYFRSVDATSGETRVSVGSSDPVDEGYCQRVVDGNLPELIIDASKIGAAAAIPATREFPIGSHLSVPIRLTDGTVYGTFCCFSYAPDPSINERDLQTIRAFADLAAHRIADELQAASVWREELDRVSQLFKEGVGSLVYQPIYRLAPLEVVGFECLSRFAVEPPQRPDQCFQRAADVGLGVELELAAARLAMRNFAALPEDCYVAVNFSPAALLNEGLRPALADGDPARIVLEVTEHAAIEDYAEFASVLAPMRAQGMKLAVDDVGAGFASMRHILKLTPDIIKLDLSLTRNIDTDGGQAALAAALVTFGEKTGCKVLAEGIETAAELAALQQLGVQYGQGYLLGRPHPHLPPRSV